MPHFLAVVLALCVAAFIQPMEAATVPLSLQIVGNGKVRGSGAVPGKSLTVGRNYKFQAQPGPGYLFAGWTGSVYEASTTLRFVMETNTLVTAVFIPNPFLAVKGTYNGLFYDTNIVDQQSSGFFNLTLGSSGSYSAKLLMNGETLRFAGTFSVDGKASSFVKRPGTNDLLARMTLDLIGASDQLTGAVLFLPTLETNYWRGELVADRAKLNAQSSPAPQAGKYTMVFPADTNALAVPTGDGFGTVNVSGAGGISFAGTLADGTKVAQKVPISKDGNWPLFASLNKGKGALLGWVKFDTNQLATDFSGRLNWFKETQPGEKYYSDGLTNETYVAGSIFRPPSRGMPVIDLTDALVTFSGGNLESDFANSVTLGSDNKIVDLGTNKLSLNISTASGTFAGSVTPPGATKSMSFRGAVLQKRKAGSGFLLGTNRSAQVQFSSP